MHKNLIAGEWMEAQGRLRNRGESVREKCLRTLRKVAKMRAGAAPR